MGPVHPQRGSLHLSGGWNCHDIGGATPLGTQTVTGSSRSIAGARPYLEPLGCIPLRVERARGGRGHVRPLAISQISSSAWAKAGIMMRATTDPGSPYYGVFVTPSNGVVVQWRNTQGGTSSQLATTGAAPVYLEVTRSGTTLGAATSTTGVSWTPIPGSTLTIANLSGGLLRGFAVTSHNTTHISTVTFDTLTTSG